MRRFRVAVIAVVVGALCLSGWQLFLRPRETGGTPTAPAFTVQLYGNGRQVAVPGDYAGKWIWLMFSGKD